MDIPFSTAQQPCRFLKHPWLPGRRVFPFFHTYPCSQTKAFVRKAIYCNSSLGDFRNAFSNRCKALLRSGNERKPVCAPDFVYRSTLEDASGNARWVPLLLYRTILLVGIGLGTASPAIAGAPPSTSEVLVQKAVGKATRNAAEKSVAQSETAVTADNSIAEKTPQVVAENNVEFRLDEAFWKDLDLSRGSILAILKGILDGNPTDRDALECLAKTLADSDTPSHALTVIEKLERLEPDEMEWKYLKAFAYDMSGQFEPAKRSYQEILKVEPYSSKAIQGLMMAMDELDEVDALAEMVDQTMNRAREEDNYTEARNIAMLIGQFFMMKGHLREALEHYQEMLQEDAKDFRPHLCQGIIYSALGEKAKAEQKFKAYEKLCPKDYPERKYLDALMRKAKREGQKRFEEKQKEKYVRIPKEKQDEYSSWGPKDEKQVPSDK